MYYFPNLLNPLRCCLLFWRGSKFVNVEYTQHFRQGWLWNYEPMQFVWTAYIFIGLDMIKTTECALITHLIFGISISTHLNFSHLSCVLLLLKSPKSNSLLTESSFHSSDGANYQKINGGVLQINLFQHSWPKGLQILIIVYMWLFYRWMVVVVSTPQHISKFGLELGNISIF